MTDIENYARRAVASPIAEPPSLEVIELLATRRRRRRWAGRIAGGLVLALLAVAGASALIRDDRKPRVAVAPSSSLPPTTAASLTDANYNIENLTHDLENAGKRAISNGTAPGSPLTVEAQVLCVDRTDVRVYQYPTLGDRLAVSSTISPDGSEVGDPRRGRTIVEWVGPPHFYARGRIIVLALSDDGSLLDALRRVLGPTLSPLALGHPLVKTTTCTTNS